MIFLKGDLFVLAQLSISYIPAIPLSTIFSLFLYCIFWRRWNLANSIFSMEEITFQIGYENSSSFRKVFKKYSGLSPAEYRK
ncbi:MAG: helix-turn-helix domain-containing protein [Thermodesulfobacteriota bacterium]